MLKVLEYEKDCRNSYGFLQNLLIDVDYFKVKKKFNLLKILIQKYLQVFLSIKYGFKMDEKF